MEEDSTEVLLSQIVRIQNTSQEMNIGKPYLRMPISGQTGTGFITDIRPLDKKRFGKEDRYLVLIMTCAHVVADSVYLTVKFQQNNTDAKGYPAHVVSMVPSYDIARIVCVVPSSVRSKIRSCKFSTTPLRVEDRVRAIGYPMGSHGPKISSGEYAGFEHLLQITAPISPGNSGGPLFNSKGEVVGVNTAKVVAEVAEGIAYSVPSIMVMNCEPEMRRREERIIDELFSMADAKEHLLGGGPSHIPNPIIHLPTFGFELTKTSPCVLESLERVLGRPVNAATIATVLEGSPAEAAGLRSGMIIESVDGVEIDAHVECITPYASHRVQAQVVLNGFVDSERDYVFKILRPSDTASSSLREHVHDDWIAEELRISPSDFLCEGFRPVDYPFERLDYVVLGGLVLTRVHAKLVSVVKGMATDSPLSRMRASDRIKAHVVVSAVIKDSDAALHSGIRPCDLIETINGEEVRTLEDVRRIVREALAKKKDDDAILCVVKTADGQRLGIKQRTLKKDERLVQTEGGVSEFSSSP